MVITGNTPHTKDPTSVATSACLYTRHVKCMLTRYMASSIRKEVGVEGSAMCVGVYSGESNLIKTEG